MSNATFYSLSILALLMLFGAGIIELQLAEAERRIKKLEAKENFIKYGTNEVRVDCIDKNLFTQEELETLQSDSYTRKPNPVFFLTEGDRIIIRTKTRGRL